MPSKPPSWCAKCSKPHSGPCPQRKAWDKPAAKKKQSGRGGRPWRRKRERIFNRDSFLCQIHSRKGELVGVELHGPRAGICDHIIPLEEGGTDDDENLQTICKACDKEKTQAESLRGRGY